MKKYAKATGSVQDGEDVVHNAYERALKYIYSYNEEMDFNAWMGTILTNAFKDFRVERSGFTVDINPDLLEAKYYPHTVDFEKLVAKYMSKLNSTHKEIVRLHCDFGYTPKEIGEVVELNSGSIRTILSRFRLCMREFQ